MIDEGYRKSTAPIKLTKEAPNGPVIPRDDFNVKVSADNKIPMDCMRYVEHEGKSYALTYWNCPREVIDNTIHYDGVTYKCSECKIVTWVEVEI